MSTTAHNLGKYVATLKEEDHTHVVAKFEALENAVNAKYGYEVAKDVNGLIQKIDKVTHAAHFVPGLKDARSEFVKAFEKFEDALEEAVDAHAERTGKNHPSSYVLNEVLFGKEYADRVAKMEGA